MTHINLNARFPGTCRCSRTFAQGARITYDPQTRRVTSCYDCIEALKAETMRRLQAAIAPLDATRSRL
jgi:hypothetical protein